MNRSFRKLSYHTIILSSMAWSYCVLFVSMERVFRIGTFLWDLYWEFDVTGVLIYLRSYRESTTHSFRVTNAMVRSFICHVALFNATNEPKLNTAKLLGGWVQQSLSSITKILSLATLSIPQSERILHRKLKSNQYEFSFNLEFFDIPSVDLTVGSNKDRALIYMIYHGLQISWDAS